MGSASADLSRARERMDELLMSSPSSGLFILPEEDSLAGRFVTQGALLGYIMGVSDSMVVVVVDQSDISLVRENTRRVELRLAGSLSRLHTARIDRQIPAASDRLPSRVLGTAGGGAIPVNPDRCSGAADR